MGLVVHQRPSHPTEYKEEINREILSRETEVERERNGGERVEVERERKWRRERDLTGDPSSPGPPFSPSFPGIP